MNKQYIVTNFAYGTGPYLMTTKLAVAFNDELEKAGHPRMGIIVPWVYGEKQKKIMAEEGLLSDSSATANAGQASSPRDEIILDAKLGRILEKVFYGNSDYETYLKKWTANFKEVSREANKYLTEKYGSTSLTTSGSGIAIELNRSPRLLYGVAPSYSTSFGYMSQIFNKATDISSIPIPKELLKKAEEISKCIEREQQIQAITYPGVFSYEKTYQPVYKNEIPAPPIAPMPQPNTAEIERGIFVTKTGIPGLSRLYKDAEDLGVKIYTNGEYSPVMITNNNTLLHFARSGWASVWRSMLAEKPIVAPEYDPNDDPEIYFNNLAIEATGIGMVYRGELLGEILDKRDKAKLACQKIKEEILERWGTWNGISYCAEIFAKEFLKNV